MADILFMASNRKLKKKKKMVKQETANGPHSIGGKKNASGIMSIRIVKDSEFQAITNFH